VKTLVIYQSIHHGNTKKIAQVIAKALQAELLSIDKTTPEIFKKYDLVGFGSGVYFGRPHRLLLALIKKLPPQNGKKAFVFFTSGMREVPIINPFGARLKKELVKKKFQVIGQFVCRGWDTYPLLTRVVGGINKGHPNQKDLARAQCFTKNLKNTPG
jgi:flavodoxin